MITQQKPITDSIVQQLLLPKEKLQERSSQYPSFKIGLPSTIAQTDSRIPLTPQGVELLVNNGHEILIESDAGARASFSDRDYAESGAQICKERSEVLQADIVIMMSPLLEGEIGLARGRQLILSPLYISQRNELYMRKLMAKRMTCVAFEFLEDNDGVFPVSQMLSEITGCVAVNVACEYLSNSREGRGVFLGGITGLSPSEIVILGSGTVAEFATRTALGMGAVVKVFDDSVARLRELQERINQRIFTSVYYPQALKKALRSADVLLGALPQDKPLNILIPEDLIQEMKNGAVAIDLNVIQGGCFETSQLTCLNRPTFKKHGVIHYCVPNITARVARTTSIALSNIISSLVLEMARSGSIENHIRTNSGFQAGVYLYNGILVSPLISERLRIPFKMLQLLLAAF